MKRFYEKGKLDKKWIELYCKGDWESCVRYQMEEKGELHPECVKEIFRRNKYSSGHPIL